MRADCSRWKPSLPWSGDIAALQTMRTGASSLQFNTGIQPEVVDVLLAVTLLLVSLPMIARLVVGRRAGRGLTVTSGWGN